MTPSPTCACHDGIHFAFHRAQARAAPYGLEVTWAVDESEWDVEDEPAPPVLASATVADPTAPEDLSLVPSLLTGTERPRGRLAGLQRISLASWRDPYMLDVEAELLDQAVDELEAEIERAAVAEADLATGRRTRG